MTDWIGTYYASDPWTGLTSNQRDWYVPALLETYHKRAVYASFVPTKVDLEAQRTQTMHFNMMFDLEPNIATIGNTDQWLTSQYTDSAALTVTMEHHAGKVSLHRFDD